MQNNKINQRTLPGSHEMEMCRTLLTVWADLDIFICKNRWLRGLLGFRFCIFILNFHFSFRQIPKSRQLDPIINQSEQWGCAPCWCSYQCRCYCINILFSFIDFGLKYSISLLRSLWAWNFHSSFKIGHCHSYCDTCHMFDRQHPALLNSQWHDN